MNTSINAVAKRYRYTGKERDDETGLYYHGARYYCCWLARWMAVDPICSELYNLQHEQLYRNLERNYIELTASSYEYCYDNPVRFIDPTGEQYTPKSDPVWNFANLPMVDMTGAPAYKRRNAAGFQRDMNYWAKQYFKDNPDAASQVNIVRVKERMPPIVDKTWVDHTEKYGASQANF